MFTHQTQTDSTAPGSMTREVSTSDSFQGWSSSVQNNTWHRKKDTTLRAQQRGSAELGRVVLQLCTRYKGTVECSFLSRVPQHKCAFVLELDDHSAELRTCGECEHLNNQSVLSRLHVFGILNSFTRTKSVSMISCSNLVISTSITSTRSIKCQVLATVPALSSMLSTSCFWL